MPASNIVRTCWQLLLLFMLSMPAYAESFKIESAYVTKIGNGYILDAKIDYPLTERVIEAIENSVPIVFSQQLKLVEQTAILGKYWTWETIIWSTELRYEIRYHALSQQYVLRDIATDHRRNFLFLDEALQQLGQINALNLPPEFLISTEDLSLLVRSELDLYALPSPMRPGALISNKWQLASPWIPAQWD